MSTVAAFARRRRRGISTVITDFVAAELVWIDGPPSLTALGATAACRAVVRNAEHQTLVSLTPTYASGTPANVAVNSSGICTAVANGTSVITASYAGLTSITQTATVAQVVTSASISPVAPTVIVGATQQFRVYPKDANQYDVVSPGTPTWYAGSNVDGAVYGSVDSTGLFTASSLRAGDNRGYINATFPNGFASQFAGITIAVPTVASIDTSIFQQGVSAQSFTLTGSNFGTDATPVISGLSGTTVADFTVVNSTTITGHITCTAGATIGSGTIAVTSAVSGTSGTVAISVSAPSYTLTATPSSISGAPNATQQLTILENGVDVTSDSGTGYSIDDTSIATVDAPTLTSVSPSTITQGASGSYTFTGTNIKGTETIGGLPTGVSASSYSYTSTTVTCTLTATGSATTGAASVSLVASGRGTSGTQTLTVNASVTAPGGVTSGLALWLVADAGTSTTTDGAAISSWTDQSPNGYSLAQATGTAQPTYQATGGANSQPCVRFAGSQWLQSAAALSAVNGSDVTLYVVAKSTGGAGTGRNLVVNYDSGAQAGFQLALTTSNSYRVTAGDTVSHSDMTGTGTTAFNIHHFYGDHASAGNSRYYLDSSLYGSLNNPYKAQSGTVVFAVGASPGGSSSGAWDVCQVIAYSRTITKGSSDDTAIRSYLTTKYGAI